MFIASKSKNFRNSHHTHHRSTTLKTSFSISRKTGKVGHNKNSLLAVDHYEKLMQNIGLPKYQKIVNSIANINEPLKEYLQKQGIKLLKPVDIQRFQYISQMTQSRLMKMSTVSSFSQPTKIIINKNDQNIKKYIRKGFIDIYNKLKQQQLTNFLKQTNYLQQIFSKSIIDLQHSHESYQGQKILKIKKNIIQNIFQQEKEIGEFKFIGDLERRKTRYIDKLNNGFMKICKQNSKNQLKL